MRKVDKPLIRVLIRLFSFAVVLAMGVTAYAQAVSPKMYAEMRWRSIGPFRAGRVLAVAGIPSEPNVFYFGSVDGGVWKTENAGRTWQPVFQYEPVSSIGAIAIAPSDPNVIYVGTGEADMRSDMSFGDGVYKSSDGGRTWKHMGLTDTRHIGRILVDPRDPNVVLVAALGHAYNANAERGVFRSTDGGKTWTKVLYKNENTGAIDLASAVGNPRIVYAALWQARRTTWSQYPPMGGPGGGIYKSTDEGKTWHELAGHGLPAKPYGRIGVAAGTGSVVYAEIDCKEGGLYRSNNGGASWTHVSGDPRIWGRGWYFSRVVVNPKNPNTVWVPDVALYRSTDGGRRFTTVKGSPGGDDYHILWIDPKNTKHIIVGSDQGAVVSVDGGRTWSSWYNQPTGQFYHVTTDNRVPFHIYAAQQDSGTVGVLSRSNYGSLSFRSWRSVGGGECGYIVPDPTNPNIVYGGDNYGILHKWNAITTQSETISPALVTPFGVNIAKRKFRFTWTSPIAFSPQNPHLMYYGAQYLLETTDGGSSWKIASPDLTVRPGTEGKPQRGVVYTIAPSALREGEIWVGTDNGLIQLTLDGGKTWKDVTPPGLTDWSKISLIEASHFDPATAFAAVDRHRLGDLHPYIYVTHDYGKIWKKITNGISAPAYVHAVREDPVRRGLLFAGTETGIYVSFDDGGHWESLQQNLPTVSIRDMAIEQGDLVVATHGRGLWVMNDIAPLRQLTKEVTESASYLFQPRKVYRYRRSTNTDTPLPPETPHGANPPAGAIFDYWLKSTPKGPVTLEILDADGKLVRRYSSADTPKPPDMNLYPVAAYWARPVVKLSAKAGMHRFVWDLHYGPPEAVSHDFPISAIPHKTPLDPQGPLAAPGKYTVNLTAGGETHTETFELLKDPAVKTSQAALEAQLDLAREITGAMDESYNALMQARAALQRLEGRKEHGAEARAAAAVEAKLRALTNDDSGLAQVNDQLSSLLDAVESADVAPTVNAQQTWQEVQKTLDRRLAAWRKIRTSELPRLGRE